MANEGKRVTLTELQHLRIMTSVFEEMVSHGECSSEKMKDALTLFSRKVHKKIFSPPKERLATSFKVEKAVREALGEAVN